MTTEPTTPTTDADPTPPTFDERLEDIFARRFANEDTDAPDPATTDPAAGADAPAAATTDEPAAGATDPAPALDPAPAGAADPAVDPAPAAAPAAGEPAPGAVAFDPTKFGVGDPEPDPAPAATPTVLSVPTPNGQTFDLDVTTAQSLLALGAWSQNLAPDVREAFAAIEQGQAVAVDRQDYERFAAWKQTHGADASEYDDLDPALAQRIARLEQENAQLRTQPLAQQYSAQADQATASFMDTAAQYATQRGLSQDEMSQVFQSAVESGVIGTLAESMRTYSPSGALLRDCDYTEVARRAFDYALIQNPHLHSRVLHAAADANPVGAPAPVAPGTAPVEPDPTAIKKARAGSLASAPSAAVATPPVDVRAMSHEDRQAAMAAEISAAMRS